MISNLEKRLLTSAILVVLFFLMFKFDLILFFGLFIIGFICIIEFKNILKKIFLKNRKYKFNKELFWIVILTFIFSSYIIIIFTICYWIAINDKIIKIFLIYFTIICILSDIGGYIFGKLLKGPKLTKISPNKTFAGSIGSLVLVVIFSITGIYFKLFSIKIEQVFFLTLVSICTAILCQLGDLFFSYLKRKAKIKDTGKLFPGHGGVLDRLDGILLGVPGGFFITFILQYINII